jgi:hypothetical protein
MRGEARGGSVHGRRKQDRCPDKRNQDFHKCWHAMPASRPATRRKPPTIPTAMSHQARTLARQHLAGQEASDTTDDDPDDETPLGNLRAALRR